MRILNGASTPEGGAAEKPDLQAVLEHYGCYASHDGKYLCLVHDEDHPSMNVSLREGLWMCHSCGAGGDAWTLIMKKEDTDFNGARAFAASAGFEGAAHDGGGEDVSGVLGRRRPGVSRGSRTTRSRPWRRPW